MSIMQVIRIAIAKSKHGKEMQRQHPVMFPVALTLMLLFYAPLILFNYVKQGLWRV